MYPSTCVTTSGTEAAKIGNISIARTDTEMSTAGTDCGGDSPRTDVMLVDLVALAHRVLAHEGRLEEHSCKPVPVQPTQIDMMALARANFRKWNDALQTKDAKAVGSMYSDNDLPFLPTVSPKHISKLGCTEAYFELCFTKDPVGTIKDDSVQVCESGNAYLHSGLYTFDLGQGGTRAPMEARFSYMWRKEDGVWKITHHHSSVSPAPTGEKLQVRKNVGWARTWLASFFERRPKLQSRMRPAPS